MWTIKCYAQALVLCLCNRGVQSYPKSQAQLRKLVESDEALARLD